VQYVKLILITLIAVLSSYANLGKGAQEGELKQGMVNPGYQEQLEWFKHSFLDLREDIEEATAADKRLMLYFYQDGCPHCKKLLQDNFGQREVVQKTRQYFGLIAINMWGDREVVDLQGNVTSEKRFARDLEVMFTPTLLLLNEEGEIVLRVNGYYAPHRFLAAVDYVGRKQEENTSFRTYLAGLTPEKASGQFHNSPDFLQPPYRFERPSSGDAKPLLVLFEQRVCAACDELHLDILAREESRELLKSFDVALLDLWASEYIESPQGKRLPITQWASALDVKYAPSLVFFDQDGREVFRTEAYLKAFHIQSVLNYVASKAYLKEPEFQRYIEERAARLRASGVEVNLME
jgi:thioredoxin-related protein